MTQRILLLKVNAESGQTMGKYVIKDDFIHLSHANGVYLLDDRLCILAVSSFHHLPPCTVTCNSRSFTPSDLSAFADTLQAITPLSEGAVWLR